MDWHHGIKTDLNCSKIAQKWTKECLFKALSQNFPKKNGDSAALRCISPLMADKKKFG
jgi:hypothetical protein